MYYIPIFFSLKWQDCTVQDYPDQYESNAKFNLQPNVILKPFKWASCFSELDKRLCTIVVIVVYDMR